MSYGDPSVSCIKREPSQEAFDQRGEYSYSIRVGIVGSEFFRAKEGVDPSRDVIRRIGRHASVRVERFSQRGFLAWAELVVEEFCSSRNNRISEV